MKNTCFVAMVYFTGVVRGYCAPSEKPLIVFENILSQKATIDASNLSLEKSCTGIVAVIEKKFGNQDISVSFRGPLLDKDISLKFDDLSYREMFKRLASANACLVTFDSRTRTIVFSDASYHYNHYLVKRTLIFDSALSRLGVVEDLSAEEIVAKFKNENIYLLVSSKSKSDIVIEIDVLNLDGLNLILSRRLD